ncbi:MAG: type IX secretion system outer membrane channel protein PorV, partial [Bacteroidetes bacterium]|nr:type IX secretion system outer membrane channel protein PorV [Bacteroidota bacterium]
VNAVTTAAPFLLIAPDSRAGGMGDMGVATSADNYSQHHNPAKYVFNEDIFGIGIAYSPWLNKLVSDVNLAYLATFWKVTDNDAIAFSLRYFSLGEIQFTDNFGGALNTANPNEFALDFTYSRKLSNIVSMAVTPRFVYSNLTAGFHSQGTGIDMKAGLAGAVDISLFLNKEFRHTSAGLKSSELLFGVNISNIGNKVSYTNDDVRRDFLPCNLRLGLSYIMAFDDYNKLAVGAEAGKLLVPTPPLRYRDTVTNQDAFFGNNGKNMQEINSIEGIGYAFFGAPGGFSEKMREVVWSFGVEYAYRDILFVRTGTFLESKYKGGRQFATVGVGVKYSIFAIDVCYLFPFKHLHPLENTLRFSLTFMLQSFKKDQIKNQGKINK